MQELQSVFTRCKKGSKGKSKNKGKNNLRSRTSIMFADFVAVEATGKINALRDLVALQIKLRTIVMLHQQQQVCISQH